MSGTQNEYFPLDRKTTYSVGRSEKLPIQALDEYVSREHVRIYFNSGKNCFCALNLNSKHGVFVNGDKIEAETALNDEDRIRIGDTIILFPEQDFDDSESAFSHFKRTGELHNPTQLDY